MIDEVTKPEDLPLEDALAIGSALHRQYCCDCRADPVTFFAWLACNSGFGLHDAARLALLSVQYESLIAEGVEIANTAYALELLELNDEDLSASEHIAWQLLRISLPKKI